MTRLTRSDLIHWADTKEAEGLLPELIRRLIRASNNSIETIVIPFGDSVGRSGLDGYVVTTSASEFVAEGESVWEFGRDKDPRKKANDDFKKRTNGTSQSRQQAQTFCCVTPRHWEKKSDWEQNPGPIDPRITYEWRKVKVYDIDDLLGWLTDCPAVEAWFARKLNKATAGSRDVDGYWENVSQTNTGIICPRVLLGGREEQAKQIQSFFANKETPSKILSISSQSPAEIVPFAVASLADSRDEAVIAKTVVVDYRNRWEQLIAEESDLGLIVSPQVQPMREELQQAIKQNHRVVYCNQTHGLALPRLSEHEVQTSLISSGFGEGEAAQHAKHCGGNGQLLLDRLSGLSSPAEMLGAKLDDRVKVACLLLVAWNGEHTADREFFSMLSGLPYKTTETALVADSNDPDGLLFRADGKFRLKSPELAWIQHARLISKSVIENYAVLVRYLLADDDPTVGLSDEDRLVAQFLGKRPEFSGTLRQNVVHSLAIASSIDSARLNLDSSMNPSFVDWIVRSTLKDANFHRWGSLRSELSILAEAAPEALLDALERDLQKNGPLHEVMQRSESGLFSSSAQVGILWALERLCWSPDYLERATSVLLRLATINLDIQSGNNPTNSICETLQLHCPQTNADWEIRRQSIKRMLDEDPDTATRIVIALFPGHHSTWMVREKPTWRNWAHGYRSGRSWRDIGNERSWCVEQLMMAAGESEDRWCELVELSGMIDDEQFDHVLNGLALKLKSDVFSDQAKRTLWETINVLLIRMDWNASQRRLKDGQIVDEQKITDPDIESQPHFRGEVNRYLRFGSSLRQLLSSSKPSDPVLASCHAFLGGTGKAHYSYHFSDRLGHQKQQEQISEARTSFSRSIYRHEGMAGLQRLAAIPDVDAMDVGRTAAVLSSELSIELDQIVPLFSSEVVTDRAFARGYTETWGWEQQANLSTQILPILNLLPCVEPKALFLSSLPPVQEVWDFVDGQDTDLQQLYWRVATVPWEIPENRIEHLANKLVQAGRADRAIELLARHDARIPNDATEPVFASLELLPSVVVQEIDGPKRGNLRWEIQKVFQVLYKIGMSQAERLVRLEVLYHQVFEKDDSRVFQPKGLLVAIRDNPSLFIDLLAYPYKNDSGELTLEDNDSTRVLANQIGRLLFKLSELPGQSELCPLSGKTTAQWVAEALRIATERQYISALQIVLSKILTCQAWNDVGSWPTSETREVINLLAEKRPEVFRNELACELQNARGVHWVDPTGQSETNEAAKIRTRADQLQRSCPVAAQALREIADQLKSEARQNVERAKWNQ